MYESDQVIAKIEVEIQEELKEEDPNRFRQSKKWQKFKKTTKIRIQNNRILMEKVTKNNHSIKTSSNQSGNYPNNGNNILTSRER